MRRLNQYISFALCARMLLLLGAAAVSSVRAEEPDSRTIVFFLDTSGSMNNEWVGGKKIVSAKQALREVLQLLPQSASIGLLTFDGWKYPLSQRNEQKFIAAVDDVGAGGRTPLGKFIKIAADALLQKKKENYGLGSYQLFIITDGESTEMLPLVDTYTPEVVARGIRLDVIGVDMASEHSLKNYANSYWNANDPAALTEAVSKVMAEFSVGDPDAQEAFDILQSIPGEVLGAMTAALSNNLKDTSPIGEKPEIQAASESSQTPADSVSQQQGCSGGVVLLIILGIFVVIFVILFFKAISL